MSLRTMDFDAIAAATPLDRNASTVRDGSGDQWDVAIPADYSHWKAPPLPLATGPRKKPDTDLAGRQLGRLTVVRFHGFSGISTPVPVWLVRCVCGDYEVRRHKSIMAGAEPNEACFVCKAMDRIRIRGAKPNTKKRRKAAAALLDRLAATG